MVKPLACTIRTGVAVIGAALLAACGSATPPRIQRDAPVAERQATYDAHALRFNNSVLLPQWVRKDGEYIMGALDKVAEPYPKARETLSDGQLRGAVIGGIAGAGSGMMGYTFGYNFTAPEDQRMSDDTQVTLYAAGAGLMLTGLIIGLIWDNPMDEFADTYNAELRADLELPPAEKTPAE